MVAVHCIRPGPRRLRPLLAQVVDLLAELRAVEIGLGEGRGTALGKNRLASGPGGQFRRVAEEPCQSVRRPSRRQLEESPARRLEAPGIRDGIPRGGDAAREVPLGRRDCLICDPFDRPVRIGEADVPA
ncbi:MAG: hypothetical protein V9G18_09955 [Albidovulum sp.]